MAAAWRRLGLSRLTLDIIELPDRRLNRASLQVAAEELAHGDTEVTVLLPRIHYTRVWHRLLHDRTADSIAQALTSLPHCNVTIVPYHLSVGAVKRKSAPVPASGPEIRPHHNGRHSNHNGADDLVVPQPDGCVPLRHLPLRTRVTVAGRVHAVRVQPWGGAPSLEATIKDGTGEITLVFLGRREVGGVRPGAALSAQGVVGAHHNRIAMLNPAYTLLWTPDITAHH